MQRIIIYIAYILSLFIRGFFLYIYRFIYKSVNGRPKSKADKSKLSGPWKHDYIHTNDIKLHYVTAGEGPLMLMLHGFPEFWYSWRYQIIEFSKYYKVVALDLRGYNESDKPQKKSAYQMNELVKDIVGVVRALSKNNGDCVILSHDWGGLIAWNVAYYHPNLIKKLVVLGSLHPYSVNIFKTWNWRQLIKSWYVFIFMIYDVPEIILSRNDYQVINNAFRGKRIGCKHPENITDSDVELFKDALAIPGALTAGLNYYRNLPNYLETLSNNFGISKVPTLYLHGEDDAYLSIDSIRGTERFIEDYRYLIIADCSHWINQDCWKLVNTEIHKFLDQKKEL